MKAKSLECVFCALASGEGSPARTGNAESKRGQQDGRMAFSWLPWLHHRNPHHASSTECPRLSRVQDKSRSVLG